ncbi:transposase [Methylobacterium ajmalii]|uniref:Transposase n=1 Tax=Methylobacterium ajmalii TaxID=2738439 RepID=A0ABV0A214_9HYPH
MPFPCRCNTRISNAASSPTIRASSRRRRPAYGLGQVSVGDWVSFTSAATTGLARGSTALVRAAGKGKPVADDQDAAADIEAWITKARTSEGSASATFASGLEADIAAVRAALREPWSSGQAEGQVNQLKLIKRQCYGRAGLELLKRRMVLAA